MDFVCLIVFDCNVYLVSNKTPHFVMYILGEGFELSVSNSMINDFIGPIPDTFCFSSVCSML